MTATKNVICPGCGTAYRMPAQTSKTSATCKKCGASVPLQQAAPEPDPAAAAVRARSTRAARALGVRNRQPVSKVHVLTGVVTLAAIVIAVVIGLT